MQISAKTDSTEQAKIVASLTAKSLLFLDAGGNEPRYRIEEMMRAYLQRVSGADEGIDGPWLAERTEFKLLGA